jgi:hypothetical protein
VPPGREATELRCVTRHPLAALPWTTSTAQFQAIRRGAGVFVEDSGRAFIMKFDTLTSVAGLAEGPASTVRGIPGGGLPWVVETGSGSLSRDGHLQVRIRGLVLASDPPVPRSLRGRNPFPAFRVVVSCLSIGPDGTAVISNVSTGDFEANSCGNSDIDARLTPPPHCTEPILLVTGPSGVDRWLAVTGR